ncbi:hypothetical protein GQ53DRAFT_816516 [Thozetella sp. PMI_491]|nr:hypothetical protein GQ53DRAFT_816516 [Thozetella sp. PMI_491]
MAGATLKVPQISHEELAAFHEAHLSKAAADNFGSQFLCPLAGAADPTSVLDAEEDGNYYEEEEEDDGLGYYPDGVKRTLTDEQIAMFRHSELESLRRAKEKAGNQGHERGELHPTEDGEMLSEGEISSGAPAPTTKKKKKKRRNNKHRTQTEGQQIDLRKRTWDVVDTGLDSLDYGETEGAPSPAANPAQRRRIAYDDD